MRVFTVAQGAVQLVVDVEVGGEEIATLNAELLREVVGDGAVIVSGVIEGFGHQTAAQRQIEGTAFDGGDDFGVVGRADHDANRGVVLRSRAHQRRATDVDVFHGVFEGHVGFVHGFAEGVEVDDDEVNRRDAVFEHDGVVGTAPAKNTAVDSRVQGFHPPRHHLREAGVLAYILDGKPRLTQRLRRAAGREDFHSAGGEAGGKFDNATFIRHAD